ncbi:MAG: tetratricopeptide repeat protein, partial [Gemmatimonadota bacterium]
RFPTSAWYRLVPVALLGMLLGGCTSGEDAPSASTAEILAARGAGEAYLQQDRLDEALAEFGRLVEIAPHEPAGYAGLGLIALREGRFTDAEEFLAEARSRAPDDPELILALARIRQETGDAAGARSLLLEALDRDPTHARTLWLLAAIEAVAQGPGSPAHVERLEAVAAVEPGNLAVLVELIDARLASGSTDMALEGLEAFRSLAPDLSAEADAVFAEAENAARTEDASGAAAAFAEFRRDFELTGVYQGDAVALRPPAGRLVGIPFLRFSSTDNLRVIEQDAVLAALRFADASGLSGFTDLMAARTDSAGLASAGLASAGLASALAIGDFDLDGDEDALWLDAGVGRFLRVDLGRFVDVSADLGEFESEDAGDLLFVDLDDDRRLDVYVGGPAPSFRRQLSDGTFVAVSTAAAGLVAAAGDTRRTVAADLDQDGDLDIFEVRTGPNR